MTAMLFKKGKIVTGTKTQKGDLRVVGEKIAEVGNQLEPRQGEEVFDLEGCYLFPGIIDSHTHFSLEARGTVSDDDPRAGGVSALWGGVTTVIDYADFLPEEPIGASIEKRKKVFSQCPVDYHFHLVLNKHFTVDRLSELKDLVSMGITSLKLFTTYPDAGYMLAENLWPDILKKCKEIGLLVTVHAEDNSIIEEKTESYRKAGLLDFKYHSRHRPAEAEVEAVKWLRGMVEKTDCPMYIVHISTGGAWEVLAEARDRGLPMLGETTPHYLLLDENLFNYPRAARNIMTPPLRRGADRECLWKGLAGGSIDVVATDHCAFTEERKLNAENALEILPGIPGVETLLPLTYSYGVESKRFSVERLVRVLSENPAKIFGLYPQKGSLEIGSDADIVVYDPQPRWVLKDEDLHSEAGYSPFSGLEIKGRVRLTMLRGEVKVRDGDFIGKDSGGQLIKGRR